MIFIRKKLTICGNCHLQRGYIFSNETAITLSSRGTVALVESDRSLYKPGWKIKTQKLLTNKFYSPGQTVRIKIFTVSPSLRPANTTAKIYIIDPRGSRMAQWPDEKQSLPGIFSRNFPLTLEPVFGEWRIFAEIQGKLYNTTFTVKHYRPAKFEISVNGMKFREIKKNFLQIYSKFFRNFCIYGFFISRHFKGHPFSL